MIRSSRKAWLTAGVAALGLALSSCSSHPGTAAIVDGKHISEAQLDELAQQIEANGGEVRSRAELLILEINAAFVKPVIDDSPAVTDGVKTQMVEDCIDQFGSQQPFFGDADAASLPEPIKVLCYGQFIERFDPQAAQTLNTAQAEVSTTVNPRYGELTDDGLVTPEYLETRQE
ncbi:MAG: hypothetical protein Q3979_10270 [Actinomycetaceae bacterium]|nr:hypothetical protein [Actinomycetaceae bacterium]